MRCINGSIIHFNAQLTHIKKSVSPHSCSGLPWPPDVRVSRHQHLTEAGHVHQEDNIIAPENWKELYNIRVFLWNRHKND